MWEHIFEARLERIEPGSGAQDGEVWRPDVSRDKEYLFARFNAERHKVTTIHPKNRTPIGLQIADLREPRVQSVHRRHIRHHDQVVHFPSSVAFLVDQADFRTQYEADIVSTSFGQLSGHLAPIRILQSEQPRFFGKFKKAKQIGAEKTFL